MIYILLAIFVLLQAADGWTTYSVLSRGGTELNPLLRWVIKKIGIAPGLIATKVVTIVPFAVAVLYLPSLAGLIVAGVMIAIYAVVVRRNWRVLGQMEESQ